MHALSCLLKKTLNKVFRKKSIVGKNLPKGIGDKKPGKIPSWKIGKDRKLRGALK
jgi:hypothetical protein